MGYFQVRYDSRVVNYDRRGFIRLATDYNPCTLESVGRVKIRVFCYCCKMSTKLQGSNLFSFAGNKMYNDGVNTIYTLYSSPVFLCKI